MTAIASVIILISAAVLLANQKHVGNAAPVLGGSLLLSCLSNCPREAIMAELTVFLEFQRTATCDIKHDQLGFLSAEEVRRSALLQLANMGAIIGSNY